jgi:hypothetical protein
MPHIEDLADVIGQGEFVGDAQVGVFADFVGDRPQHDVLIVLGDRWTIVNGQAFKALAEQILPQL